LPEEREEVPHDNRHPLEGQFWRRVSCRDGVTEDPKVPGGRRPRSDVFEDGKNEFGEIDPVSAYRAVECETPIVALDGHEGFGVITIDEETIAACGLNIVNQPRPGPPGHVLLVGNKTRSVRKKLALAAQWALPCP